MDRDKQKTEDACAAIAADADRWTNSLSIASEGNST